MRKIRLLKKPEEIDFSRQQGALSQICHNHGIALLYLFGSSGTDRTSPLSDIDLAFYSKNELDPGALMGLQKDFVVLFKRDDIDLVDIKQAPPLLAYKIVKEGKPLICTDGSLKARLEYKITLKYLDTIHLRSEYHRSLRKAVLGGKFYVRA